MRKLVLFHIWQRSVRPGVSPETTYELYKTTTDPNVVNTFCRNGTGEFIYTFQEASCGI